MKTLEVKMDVTEKESFFDSKEFKEFTYNRCAEALTGNEDYMKLEHDKDADLDLLQARAEELCYIRGFKDALTMFKLC